MQQPPYPNQPPQYPYQQPYPPQYPYQPPPVPPRQPGHGAVYWTLFILFFPVTVPYVILKAVFTSHRQPAPPLPPYPQYPPPVHQPARPHRRKPSLNTRMRHANHNLRNVTRFLRWMERKPGRKF